MTAKQTIIAAAILGFLSVAIGAFAAHALKPTLDAHGRSATFELAVRYQFYHTLAMLFAGLWLRSHPSALLGWAPVLWLGGVVLFSGSLYMLSITNNKTYAMVTPVGGLLFLAGWLCLVIEAIRNKVGLG
jgi:uncharacterized membrane protein YgdD (TMEM256/DUF423 family)